MNTRIIDIHSLIPVDVVKNGYTASFDFSADEAIAFNKGDSDDDEVFSWTVTNADGDEEDSGWARSDEEAIDAAIDCINTWAHWLRLDDDVSQFDECDVTEHTENGVTYWTIDTEGEEWVIFADRDDAEAVCRAYWQSMIKHDPTEFACFVPVEALAAWCLNQPYTFPNGYIASSLKGWLDDVAGECEGHFASYDGEEVELASDDISSSMTERFAQAVAYRRN